MYSNYENIAISHYNINAATPTTAATKTEAMDPALISLATFSSTDCAETDSSDEDEEEDFDDEESPALAVESPDDEEAAAEDELLSLDAGDGREDDDGIPELLLLEESAGGARESVLLGVAEELEASDDCAEPSPIGPL